MDISISVFYSQLYFSLLGLFAIYLSYMVVDARRSEKIGIGSGDNKLMERRIRVHSNFIEYLLPFAILFLVYELSGGNEWVLKISGAVFLIARIMHAQGLAKSAGTSFGRFYGTLFTWIIIIALSIANIIHLF